MVWRRSRHTQDILKTYLLEKGPNFSSAELIRIMDSFRDRLNAHFRTEISMIIGLADHSIFQILY